MRDEGREAGLPHEHYSFRNMTVLYMLLDVCQSPDMERRVWRSAVHPGETEDTEDSVNDTCHEHIVVEGCSFFQLVAGLVDNAC